ncbi:TetR/AcrR family transcriptional regulator [Streptomyces sp. DvalAA-19]|uniref:TetR/AcrR family transcriptional regulator n=1 Tax=Streptomyces sp. DvalAA-19 TaxID=1839761 RepID=UPI00081AF08C|nr:TetR/AcrR family transcriptional regulator [Streptomyces sp. DvalAA-19]SCE09069.1 transcriptional regulator, TetR family [Streptomyces sp. DvalAA-19]
MDTETDRRPRADALRNAERIVRAAREAFAEDGPEVSLEEIARRAGVGLRTLYRHFPHKRDLVGAALGQSVVEDLAPRIEQTLASEDPLEGFVALVELAMTLVAKENALLNAAKITGSPTAEFSARFFEALASLMRRAQASGQLRADLTSEDLPRILAMLVSVLGTMKPQSRGWRRYLGFMMEGLHPSEASPQPAPPPAVSRPVGTSVLPGPTAAHTAGDAL